MNANNKRVLVIGRGNPNLSDDGIAPYVVRALEAKQLSFLTTITLPKLLPELLDDIGKYERVVFVDVHSVDVDVLIRRVQPAAAVKSARTQAPTPEFFYLLTKDLYRREPLMWVCTIRGESFDKGDTISQGVIDRAQKVIYFIEHILEEQV